MVPKVTLEGGNRVTIVSQTCTFQRNHSGVEAVRKGVLGAPHSNQLIEAVMPRFTLVTLFALLAAAPLAAQRDACRDHWGDDDRARVCDVRTLGARGLRALTIDPGSNGGAEVEAWDRDSIGVEARVLSYARTDAEARALNREVKLTFVNGVLSAEGPSTARREGWAVIFAVRVPRRIDLNIETLNGPIEVAGVTGTMQLETTNGPITLDGVNGDVRARLQNGPLSISLSGTTWDGAGLEAQTVNGPLTIRVPREYNAKLETGTRNGPFHTDIPITVQGNIGRLGQQITTTLGRGGPTIKASTTNGPLTIRSGR
jgi:putative adhesin